MATVVQLSDTHLKASSDVPARSLRAAVAAVAAEVPAIDLVLLTGDLADDGGLAATEEVRAIVAELGAPILALAGNHDDPAAVTTVFGPPAPVTLDGWCIVPVDTFVADQTAGRVDNARATTLLDGVEATGLHLLVALHHPPAGPSTHPWFVLGGAERFVPDLARRPTVRAVASGHLHQAFVQPTEGPPVVGAPSTLYAIRHEDEHWEMAPDGLIGATVWTLGAEGADHRFVSSQAQSA
jgi:Icc protein